MTHSHAPRSVGRIGLALGTFVVLWAAALVPLATAHDARESNDDRPDRAARDPPGPRGTGPGHLLARLEGGGGTHVALALEGTATGRNNTTYAVVLAGEGFARARPASDGAAFALVRATMTLSDENGTVVKEARFLALVRAQTAENETRWGFTSIGPRFFHASHVVIRGEAERTDEDTWALDGEGKVVRRGVLWETRPVLDLDVAGTLTTA